MKDKILSISFFVIIFSLFILNITFKDKDISYSERRNLTLFPNISLDKETFEHFDNYALDQFVFRDKFRTIKAWLQFNVLGKKDNNGVFFINDSIYKQEYPLNESKVNSFISKINKLYETYLKDMNVYYSIIPDKNYYLSDEYLKMDYDKMFDMVTNGINNIKYIDIRDCLTLEDYYRTDTHFKQDKINKVVNKLSLEMNFEPWKDYVVKSYEPFYGVYYGQLALNIKPDTINYLTNDDIENSKVSIYGSNLDKVYNTSLLGKMDSYDVFLAGANPLIIIENENATSDKELIFFRDSFGSTLAPLLINSYSKITLIDLRYIDANILKDFIQFDNQDVLIMYSTLIINNSETIKV